MSEPHEHVAALADKLRRTGHTGITLGFTMIAWTRQCWRDPRYRDDAQVVMDNFKRDFE
jgi:hypothetical protein